MIRGQNSGYFLFPPSAYSEMEQDFAANLQILSKGGESPLDGLILDLRVARNSGGWPIDVFLALFTNGELGTAMTRGGPEKFSVIGQDLLNSQSVPLVVLVGPDTEVAPEVFVAILQTSDRATIIGLPTPGLIEQTLEFPLPDGSRVFVAARSFETLDGVDVGARGVVPDVRIEADWDAITAELDPVVLAAIDILANQ
jgi:carboxyl-terminal processing protease